MDASARDVFDFRISDFCLCCFVRPVCVLRCERRGPFEYSITELRKLTKWEKKNKKAHTRQMLKTKCCASVVCVFEKDFRFRFRLAKPHRKLHVDNYVPMIIILLCGVCVCVLLGLDFCSTQSTAHIYAEVLTMNDALISLINHRYTFLDIFSPTIHAQLAG